MDADLHVQLIRHGERRAKHGRSGPPIFVTFKAHRTGLDLLPRRVLAVSMPLAKDAGIDSPALERSQHHFDVAWARRDRRSVGAIRRARSSANQGCRSVG